MLRRLALAGMVALLVGLVPNANRRSDTGAILVSLRHE